jgi:hypothetical protein
MFRKLLQHLFLVSLVTCCVSKKTGDDLNGFSPGTFGYDLTFIKAHKDVIVLTSAKAKVLLVAEYQGRVMTSTADGDAGTSYGWMNYELIRSGKTRLHMNPYGGEDRFWMGPEGGQFALYFKKADPFDYDHWQTPAFIDTEPFQVVSVDSAHARFAAHARFSNYLQTEFEIDIDRQIEILTAAQIDSEFHIATSGLKTVGFRSINKIINRGADWKKDTGVPSVWILGMFKPTPETVVVIPHDSAADHQGISDNYFGLIPPDRIQKGPRHLILKADGKFRGKVGIAPSIAKNVAGSYDGQKHILTLVKYDLDKKSDYVNSKWEVQATPYGGDAFNSYNDGPIQGGSQLGPFYELESSSPAKELRSGESLVHRHLTVHLEGSETALNEIAQMVLGLDVTDLSFAKD